MKCPQCDATQFAGFNGYVLCSPTDPAAPVHRLSNEAFNERLAAFEAGELDDTPKRRRKVVADAPVEPVQEEVPEPPAAPDLAPDPAADEVPITE